MSDSGGAAASGGISYQAKVSAWLAVHVLGEEAVEPPLDLSSSVTIESLSCEAPQPVDDVVALTSEDGGLFFQCKISIQLSDRVDSEFAKTIDQFVRQSLISKNKTGIALGDRPLDPARDRLVLATDSESSGRVIHDLPKLLERLRSVTLSSLSPAIATNDNERKVLAKLRSCAKSSWKNETGATPSEAELTTIFKLIRVQVLDLQDDQTHAKISKDRLRNYILVKSDDADAAWAQLCDECLHLSESRTSHDRKSLTDVLVSSNIELQGPKSFRDDIRRLQEYSSEVFEDRRKLSIISPPDINPIKIRRDAVSVLRRVILQTSVLVTGEPGSGKSGVLFDLYEELGEAFDRVYVAIDLFNPDSRSAINQELQIEHDLEDILENWSGTKPGVLIIDALDAARSGSAIVTIRRLIERVFSKVSRWRIVASIRKFDLRYDHDLKPHFKSDQLLEIPEAFLDLEFSSASHVNVTNLSDEELSEATSQLPALFQLFESSEPGLKELLREVFNLRLVCELIGSGADTDKLSIVRTQDQLLDEYWKLRVADKSETRSNHEHALYLLASEMVSTRKLVWKRNHRVDMEPGLTEMLRRNVVQESKKGTTNRLAGDHIAFSHNILFDYTVTRLILFDQPPTITQRISEDNDLILAIRPSVVMFFKWLWWEDSTRKSFWETVLDIEGSADVPEVGKLIGPSVASQSDFAETVEDYSALFGELSSSTPSSQNRAENALRHLIGALMVENLSDFSVTPWLQFTEKLSQQIRSSLSHQIYLLIRMQSNESSILNDDQFVLLGKASRRLLDFAWNQTQRNGRLVRSALEFVCRTFRSNVDESGKVLRLAMVPEHIAQYGYEELPELTGELKFILPHDSVFVSDLYRAVFSYEEQSTDTTSISDSRLMALNSNKRQDYDMAKYQLREFYPSFLQDSPEYAIPLLMDIVHSYSANNHSASGESVLTVGFQILGISCEIESDHSCIWDSSNVYDSDHPMKMLDHLIVYLEELLEQKNTNLDERIKTILGEAKNAVVWRHLIEWATSHPDSVGKKLWELASAQPALLIMDTSDKVGDFIKVIFPLLDQNKKKIIEDSIIGLLTDGDEHAIERQKHCQARLLGCIGQGNLVTDAAKTVLGDWSESQKIPDNIPPFSMRPSWEEADEDYYLREQGVELEEPSNKLLRELEDNIKSVIRSFGNRIPSAEEIENTSSDFEALAHKIETSDSDGVHPKQYEQVLDTFLDALSLYFQCEGLHAESSLVQLALPVILKGIEHPNPEPSLQDQSSFDRAGMGLSKPSPRVAASIATVRLVSIQGCCNESNKQLLTQLTSDLVPIVRSQISSRIDLLWQTDREFMWSLIKKVSTDENSGSVLHGLLTGPLNRIAMNTDNTLAVLVLVWQIYNRELRRSARKTIQPECIKIIVNLHVWKAEEKASEYLDALLMQTPGNPKILNAIIGCLRKPMKFEPSNPEASGEQKAHGIRNRAFKLVAGVLDKSYGEFLEIRTKQEDKKTFEEWDDDDLRLIKEHMRLLDFISKEAFFSSGAYSENYPDTQNRIITPQASRFFQEARQIRILDKLGEVEIVSVLHHLLEILEYFIPEDPEWIFERISHAVRTGIKEAYQFESQAADLLVRIVENYLANHRAVFESPERRKNLIEILDIFIGWPQAQRLTYKLEDIFR